MSDKIKAFRDYVDKLFHSYNIMVVRFRSLFFTSLFVNMGNRQIPLAATYR